MLKSVKVLVELLLLVATSDKRQHQLTISERVILKTTLTKEPFITYREDSVEEKLVGLKK